MDRQNGEKAKKAFHGVMTTVSYATPPGNLDRNSDLAARRTSLSAQQIERVHVDYLLALHVDCLQSERSLSLVQMERPKA